MFTLRNSKLSDLDDIYLLSKEANLLNLPSNKAKLLKLLTKSNKSFKSPDINLENNYYLFSLEDNKNKRIVGVSAIHGKHGTHAKPHYYLKVGKEIKESSSLKTKIVNHTLKLGIEPNGFTEIGGLILSPLYRGNPSKLGKQLSMVRFLYIIQFSNLFTKQIHSELLPPFDENGKSLLWEGLGRKFLNMDYWEADILSQSDKNFIHDLFPSSTIYQNLLPKNSLQVIGEVGTNTLPVKKMLESIGFKYMNEVDPFDGGPHFRANLKDLKPFKEFKRIKGSQIIEKLKINPNVIYIYDISNQSNDVDVFFSAASANYNDSDSINQIDINEIYKGFFI